MAAEDWAVAVPQTPQMEAGESAGDGRRFVQEWLAALGIETEARAKLAAELFDHGITSKVLLMALGAATVNSIVPD